MSEEERIQEILELSRQILNNARNTLIINFRYMDMAISRLKLMPWSMIETIETDGEIIAYNPEFALKSFKTNKNLPARQYLHMVMHCVFQHFLGAKLINVRLWDLACDIAIENVINGLDTSSVSIGRQDMQTAEIEKLKKKHNLKYITAEHLYRLFQDGNVDENTISKLEELFKVDSHEAWYQDVAINERVKGNDGTGNRQNQDSSENNPNNEEQQNSSYKTMDLTSRMQRQKNLLESWKNVSEQIQMDMETFSNRQGTDAGDMIQNLREVNREKYDYSEFLKKFAVMCETMKINDDEFDYIFYTYGLNLYGKMPLIEPLEYKEVKQIKEFVIAIDTSGSTSGELVQCFLQKTYNILLQSESFFTKINLHIIQCDAYIQEDYKITTREDFDQYIKTMKIRGLGGTDFRPVFSYVNNLINNKEFSNLKGLIYFTDGYGAFPAKQPEYETAFVFIDDEVNNYDVPVWAIKLILRKENILGV